MNGPRDATMAQLKIRIQEDLLARYRKWCSERHTTPLENITRYIEDKARGVSLTPEEAQKVLDRIQRRLKERGDIYTIPASKRTGDAE